MDNALLNRSIEFLLLPPGNFLLLLVLMVIWRQKRARFFGVLLLAFLQIFVLSLPATAQWLLKSLEQQAPPQVDLWRQQPPQAMPQAIVVLGAGRNRNAPEYGGESTSLAGIERLRYAALLYRQTGLPILVSGGRPLANTRSEAELMRDVLEQEYQVPVRWLEQESHTTWQNAELTDAILAQAGIQSAWLVTQAWHMPRSLLVFQDRQVKYSPASTSYGGHIPWQDGYMKWIPQATALDRSLIALHEWFGLAWYQWRKS